MSHTPHLGTDPDQPLMYEVRIKGRLSKRWDDWFDHMTVTSDSNGETTLTGTVVDQAALHGILTRIRDLGLQLLSVTKIETRGLASTQERKEPIS